MITTDYKDDNLWLMQGDCLERMKEIPTGSVDVVLVDPPYVGVVNEQWDNKTEQESKLFFDGVIKESERVLRFGGRFICFCASNTLKWLYYGDMLHRELITIDKGLQLVSGGRNTKNYRQHVNHVEYILVRTKDAHPYTKSALKHANINNLSSKEINNLMGCASNGGGMWSIYTGNNKCKQVPTKDQWAKFLDIFKTLPDYDTFKEVFNNSIGKGNILHGYNFRMKNRQHPTQKPVELLEYLIKTYTDEQESVLDFTAGSGTTGVACVNTNRKFIGIEQDEKYFCIAKERIINTKVNHE